MSIPIRAGQLWHDMLPEANHDDISRQGFVTTMMNTVGSMMDGNRTVYDKVVHPRFVRDEKREPRHVNEVRKVMLKQPYTQYWSSFKRCAKEMQYESVGPMVERQLPELIDKAEHYRTSNRKLGSLTLDPSIKAPRYNSEIEIHAKPGGYHTDLTENDVFAGAEFDRTYFVFTNGGTGADNGNAGRFMSAWMKKTLPDFKPKRILDMGCTIGGNTLPWKDAYPDAEVYGLDVAAPCLRYAHARAEALGKKVHFVQDNAEATRFEGGSFDLVVSCIMMHELAHKAIHNVYAEAYRLLKPGGYTLHSDLTPFKHKDMVEQFHTDWDTHYQAEPFITSLGLLDLTEVAAKGGFQKSKVREILAPTGGGKPQFMLLGQK